LKNNSKKNTKWQGSVDSNQLWDGRSLQDVALCELLTMNSTCLNQIAVEGQDQIIDQLDLKGQVAIGATEQEHNYDDVESWLTDLQATVQDEDLVLFPQLEQPKDVVEEDDFLDQFVDFNLLAAGPNTENNTNMDEKLLGNFDYTNFLQLDKGNIDDEVAAAAKLLSEEDNELADMLVSYMESESNVSSPEMNHQSVDVLLDDLIQPTDVTPAANTDFISEILAVNNSTSTDQVATTTMTDSNLKFPEDARVDDNVINEFVNLLNSLDEGFNNNEFVDNVNSSAYLCTNNELFDSPTEGCDAITIDNSVNSPCTAEIVQDSAVSIVNKQKRKRTNVNKDDNVLTKKVARRMKNNEASKVTRAKRKNRHKDLFEQERTLVDSNAELRIKVEVMQKEADILRQLLVVALSNANNKS